jgi:two-component system, OmpR family, sensor histidine kinase KdpD
MHETDLLDRRPSPEEFLARLRSDDARSGGRGRLRVYLGMAPGVGKTFRMLEEGHRRLARGTDVVVGFVETHGRPHTAELIEGLEVVPRRVVIHRGVTVEELDPDAVIARRPTVALIDELAHTNAPGSAAEKRWQDVERIRDAGIHVISTLNVQHLESQADAVETITGAPVRERLPDEILAGADELELVDMSPHALRQRMRHGNIYRPQAVQIALDRFFTEENLTALRELALRLVARSVEDQLDGMAEGRARNAVAAVSERVLVLVDGSPAGRAALRSAASLAARLRADLVALVPETGASSGAGASWEADRAVRADVDYAADLGAVIVRLGPGDQAAEISREARARGSTHLVLPYVPRRGVARLRASLADTILAADPTLEVHLVGGGS